MSRRILIDAEYPEEIRLVLCENNKIIQFDYQYGAKKSLKGNVYLAKVTRVEPSLRAAFVDYGQEKKGFLSFESIHPDYYQIPSADKEKLLELIKKSKEEAISQVEDQLPDDFEGNKSDVAEEYTDTTIPEFYKKYKIQEVIKKDQIILVQVEKEERGNKGASLTTYISLPGRYCVFMPNANRGGGISRKLKDFQERERLRGIINEFCKDNPAASVIVRTAGIHKTKAEIKKDFEYLNALWNNIKEQTMVSMAPSFIYEEGDIIKKGLRDFYDSEVEEIVISGRALYGKAKKFMSMLLQRNTNKVKLYKGSSNIFVKYDLEAEIEALYSNKVLLESGGYIVINQTEALVAIDVNSGKYTEEHNIEGTALKINMEATKEIAKQLKLRDLSGLLVIDFIDMYELQNRIAVEKEFRAVLSNDKAKVHLGRISEFGLLEMSRQRTGQSFIEVSSISCPYCKGVGRVKSIALTALNVMREINRNLINKNIVAIKICGTTELILYILNNKKESILELEKNCNLKMEFYIDELLDVDMFKVEVLEKNQRNYKLIYPKGKHSSLKPYTQSKEPKNSIDDSLKYFKPSNKKHLIKKYHHSSQDNKINYNKDIKKPGSYKKNLKKENPVSLLKIWKTLLSKK